MFALGAKDHGEVLKCPVCLALLIALENVLRVREEHHHVEVQSQEAKGFPELAKDLPGLRAQSVAGTELELLFDIKPSQQQVVPQLRNPLNH